MRTSAYQIELSNVDEMLVHASALFKAHWQEIALNKRLMVLEPHELRYRALEAAGAMLALAAWTPEQQLVGYAVSFITQHLHYAGLTYAQNDILFVAQEHRRTGLGLDLIAETERIAKERGAQLVLWHAKQGTALDRLLGRPSSKYRVQDVIYSREL